MSVTERFCASCDQTTEEWFLDNGQESCPMCAATLYENYSVYVEAMIVWLGRIENMDEQEVREFLTEHGNPTKGQALAIRGQHD